MGKKYLFILALLIAFNATYAQVGISTETPKATLDVTASKTDDTTAEGIIAPRLTRIQVISKDAQYTANQTGAILYVTDLSGTTTAKTANVTKTGYYYFDGALWQPFTVDNMPNPLYKVGTTSPSTLNTDNSYLNAKMVVGGDTVASVNGGTANAVLTVTNGDAVINDITVGKGRGGEMTNTTVGVGGLEANTTGSVLTAVGFNTLVANTTGVDNTAIGGFALTGNTNGSGNTAIGYNALGSNITGSQNTAIGALAGSTITSGHDNLVIGNYAQVPSATGSNQLNIGNALFGITSYEIDTPGRISIGKTAPDADASLDVKGVTKTDNLVINNSPIMAGNTTVLVRDNTTGAIGTAASVPARVAFLQSTLPQLLTTQAEKDSLNAGQPVVVQWGTADIVSNNVLTFDNATDIFTITNTGLYELSGFINYATYSTIPATYPTTVDAGRAGVNASVQVDINDGKGFVDFTSARAVFTGVAVNNTAVTVVIPPGVGSFSAGTKIRMIFKRPANNFGLPHGTPGNPGIVLPGGINFSKGMKIAAM